MTGNVRSVNDEATFCYLAGTHILTPSGEVPVERLRAGDLVTTASGAYRPIRWLGAGRTLVTPQNRDFATPVVVRKNALADNVPHRDLYITRGHALYLADALIPAEELVNHRSIVWFDLAQLVEYYHIELDSHDLVLAEGAAAETFRDDNNSEVFYNANERPPGPRVPPYAPVLHDHPTVKRVWRKLSDRAGRPNMVLTEDPDLHLLADGVRLKADSVKARVWRFHLPAPVSDLRIISRSAIPSMIGIEQDQRRLGVALRQIVLAQRGVREALRWDYAGFGPGFHTPERAQRHRWTNGDAAVPASGTGGVRGGCAGGAARQRIAAVSRTGRRAGRRPRQPAGTVAAWRAGSHRRPHAAIPGRR